MENYRVICLRMQLLDFQAVSYMLSYMLPYHHDSASLEHKRIIDIKKLVLA